MASNPVSVGLTDSAGRPVAESPELILVADDRGRYVDASRGILKALGWTREALLQLSIWDLTPAPRELDGLMLWQAFIAGGEQKGRYSLRSATGRLVEFDYTATANVAPGLHVSVLT